MTKKRKVNHGKITGAVYVWKGRKMPSSCAKHEHAATGVSAYEHISRWMNASERTNRVQLFSIIEGVHQLQLSVVQLDL